MSRICYIAGNGLCLVEYLPCDCAADYQDWLDPETQRGYNFIQEMPYEAYQNRSHPHRLYAVIVREAEPEIPLGVIMLSPPTSVPDLAIRVFAPYRGQGIGTRAFALAANYAAEELHLDTIHAGCYEGNERSERMLRKCGFVRFPEGDQQEEHYLTGEPITQYEYIYQK